MVVRHGPATFWLFLNKISGITQLNNMKPRDIFKLAVRLLGLVFLYHGLISLPTLFTGIFGSALNAFVIAKYGRDPSRSEADIFTEYEKKIGLQGDDLARFRDLNLLSTKAVLRGQATTLGAKLDLFWARDDTLAAPDLSDFINKGLVDKALDEKHQAVEMWKQIEDLSRQINFTDPATRDFVVTSCTYGRLKYSVIEQAWTILLLGKQGDTSGTYDKPKMQAAIAAYDQLWDDWRKLKATNPTCATLPNDKARGNKPGIGAAVARYRKLLAAPATQPSPP